jgi:hypothetical protein
MTFTERGDQAAGILRQHDTLGALPIPAFSCEKMPTFPSDIIGDKEISAIIAISVIIVS